MKRLYSLFEKRGARYHRVSPLSYLKPVAVHVFQSALLEAHNRSLRPVFDVWDGNTRIYRPAVGQLELLPTDREALGRRPSGYEQLADKLTGAVVQKLERRKGGKSILIEPRCRTYRTGQVLE